MGIDFFFRARRISNLSRNQKNMQNRKRIFFSCWNALDVYFFRNKVDREKGGSVTRGPRIFLAQLVLNSFPGPGPTLKHVS